jgi:hypothetical protein
LDEGVAAVSPIRTGPRDSKQARRDENFSARARITTEHAIAKTSFHAFKQSYVKFRGALGCVENIF